MNAVALHTREKYGVLLCAPGHPGRCSFFAAALTEAGYAVSAPYSGEMSGARDEWKRRLDAFRWEYAHLTRQCGRTAVAGLWEGALWALLLAEEYVLDALILADPDTMPHSCGFKRAARSADRNLFAIAAPLLLFARDDSPAADRILSGVSSRTKERVSPFSMDLSLPAMTDFLARMKNQRG